MVRQKNRYIVVQINRENETDLRRFKIGPVELHNCIMGKLEELYGDFGVAAIRAGFTTKYFNDQTRIAFIRARRGPHKFVTSCIPCIKKLGDTLICVNILYVGSSMKHCYIFVKNYQEKKFNEYCGQLKTDEEKLELRKELLNFSSVLDVCQG